MPPRYAYWTILIDNKPTAFRARDKEEMLPTFHQLRRTSRDVVLKWFARGRLWETPEDAQAAARATAAAREKRGRDWRPGGVHKDPRDRFKKGEKSRSQSPPREGAVARREAHRAPRRDHRAPSSGSPEPSKVKPGSPERG